jgi:hypothetical protein
MNENKPGCRSFLHFGLRDLLWAMAFSGAVMGGWLERQEKKRVAQTAEELEGSVITKQAVIDQYQAAPSAQD